LLDFKLQTIRIALTIGCCASVAAGAQTSASNCSQPAILKVDIVKKKTQYQFEGKSFSGYPLDAVANVMVHCWPDRPLFVITTWDVPLYLLTTPGKLQLDKVRYFIKGRDERIYTEIVYGHMYPGLPLTPDIKPIPDDDGTWHPPTKIPRTKGPQ